MENTRSQKTSTIICYVALAMGYLGLLAGTIGFGVINRDMIARRPLWTALAALVFACGPILFVLLRRKPPVKAVNVAAAVLAMAGDVAFGIVLVTNVLSPYLHSGAFVVILPVAGGLTVVGIAVSLAVTKAKALTTASSVFLVLLMVLGAGWIATQPYAAYTNVESVHTLFKGGDEGYRSYRIPALVCLHKDVLQSCLGVTPQCDVLVAIAEGRRHSSADEGEIDLVIKTSLDAGKTWGPLTVLLSYDDVQGKYGNPTPIFDSDTGLLHLIYTTTTKESKFLRYTMFDIVGTLRADLSFDWAPPRQILLEGDHIALMSGPNKGIRLSDGRLAFACYANYSDRPSEGFVVFSADHGATWTRTDTIAAGNECDLLELRDGSLLYVLRDNTPCTSIHPDTTQRFFRSTDGGLSWSEWQLDTPLRTPICQCCLNKTEEYVYLTYPDNSYCRTDLSIAYSRDAETFDVVKLYDGPSGYSSAVTLSDGKICVLAETGRVNYAAQLTFLVLD